MDYQFPQRLFPSFYNNGPPSFSVSSSGEAGGWGSYDGVLPQGGSSSLSSCTFTSKHQVRGRTWTQTEPVVVPLLTPKTALFCNLTPPDPLDFTEHMQNYYLNYSHDAFGCMSDILGEHFYFKFGKKYKEKHRRGSVNVWTMRNHIEKLKHKTCHQRFRSSSLGSYCGLLSDVVPDVPPDLLGSLLHEELTEQRDRLQFSDRTTGGALAFVPLSRSGGCLVCPGGPGLDCLAFHRVALRQHGVDLQSRASHSFQLKAPVRQISHASLFNDCCVAVRSDYLCGVWRVSETSGPRLLQVVGTREAATCVSVSPHVLGEVLVASESGTANLWTVGRGLQKVRAEDTNLYFNAKSSWRWCEFSAHPRVVLYADRTGSELTDVRAAPGSGITLFRISSASECRSGERLLQSRYLGDVHAFHHLVTTQYSAYVMDERFTCVPMLKLNHMMKAPPIFCQVVRRSAGSEAADVLFGSQSPQEVTLLQYSGGRATACFSLGPPRALLRPRDSLRHLPVQIPHRLEVTTNRLSAPAAGLTVIQEDSGSDPGGGERVCVLQLTEAGDVFYQVLEQNQDSVDQAVPQRDASEPAELRLVGSDTSRDEEAHLKRSEAADSDSSEDPGGRARRLKLLQLQVFVNDEPDAADPKEAAGGAEEDGGSSCRRRERTPSALSSRTLHTWKVWLQKLVRRSGKKKLDSELFTAERKGLLTAPDKETRGAAEEDLREAMRSCMSSRSLLLHSSDAAPGVEPVPNAVDPEEWTDELSRRLSVSWQGEEAWRAWWHDQLGLNRKWKTEALKRKRRREKEVRRAAGQQLELSGSFTSSVSYQVELDDFSSSAGWSSVTSQEAWSDEEERGLLSQLEMVLKSDLPSTPAHTETDSPPPSLTPTPLKEEQQTPSRPRVAPPSSTRHPETTPSSQRTKRPAKDYLSSLMDTQDDPSQDDPFCPPGAASTSQAHSSQPVPLRSTGSLWSRDFLTSPQASQRRRAASQTQKKKPRMGF
ncbi:TATA box-binding protein-associated factor, RNA polymerase I, subunit C [Nematolebias whitei]|uniref:TATA box-binding protein-associated factor, RNA polymerase I, subunit C n=1 Tax=Nematolebias whitei TaxID=451745 RepID=UPI00189B9479|nr:TATA box-binding protein-associated factor, RNA polymerase I, subunit C [Nematolebias whitei]